ncbi:site-specific integrase [Oculatella sp. FACHB-28]|uniref:site-specific integrase n=1 Tax=Oculatella sp. FACHB-28 TaxID=2692845 RepID=UPI00199160BC|nr:site-specific integrase [Oculatella sp. FACHB-28]MBD2055633.1 site-specific integrase [Oculatella sp. FACHB-28]
MTLMPPDRQRTYRELVEGKTLVQGELNGSHFTPKKRMANPENAKWYIRLEAPDYKTGNTYGTWWGEVPNVRYPDGKTFYGYIDEWLNHWRQVFAPNHQYFFTQPNGKPFKASSLKELIRRVFYRLLDVPGTPHILRKMFITYLYEKQVPGHVLDSAALAMHHSRHMQAQSYNRQEQSDKLRPILTLTVELAQQAVGSQT